MAFVATTTVRAGRGWAGAGISARDGGRVRVRVRVGRGRGRVRGRRAVAEAMSASTVADAVTQSVERAAEAVAEELARDNALLSGRWQRVGDNAILRPQSTRATAVVHFVGGAFVGGAPHVAYQQLLETVCERGGVVVVATAYQLSFDYVRVAERIARSWDAVESALAAELGALPVLGVAHSAGCVLLALCSCLFADSAPRVANIFLSFNNRPAAAAIPHYRRVVRPLAALLTAVADAAPPSPSPPPPCHPPPLPRALRDTLLPAAEQLRPLAQQLRPLLREAAAHPPPDFYPPPPDVAATLRALYRVRRTLLLSFRNDSLDDSHQLAALLTAARRPCRLLRLSGTHLTPVAVRAPLLPHDPHRARLVHLLLRAIRANGSLPQHLNF